MANIDQVKKKHIDLFRIFLIALYLISICVYIYYLVDGFSYYTTPLSQRPRSEDYRNLRPAGERGHGFGVIGSSMMLLLLLYSLRKRTRIFDKLGSTTQWLNIHIYFGIIGPLLIILHTSFKVYGLIAVSFWSMIAVALSGVLGRYIYIQIPHNYIGDELKLNEVEQEKLSISSQLKDRFKITEKLIARLEQVTNGKMQKEKGLLFLLFAMMKDDLTRKRRLKKIVREISTDLPVSQHQLKEVVALVDQKLLLERRILLWNKIHQLFHYWHVIHKPFAYIMLIIMFVHVIVAVLMGYSWFF